VRDSRGIARADELAGKYIAKAIAALQPLPDIQAKSDLIRMAHFVGSRSY
jgi:heptaprenyl diphosphate synthase